jgi:hypothetical protein
MVTAAYLISIIYAFYPTLFQFNPYPIQVPSKKIIFGIFQTVCLSVICITGITLDTENQKLVKSFYMLYWIMFFLEYLGFAFLY